MVMDSCSVEFGRAFSYEGSWCRDALCVWVSCEIGERTVRGMSEEVGARLKKFVVVVLMLLIAAVSVGCMPRNASAAITTSQIDQVRSDYELWNGWYWRGKSNVSWWPWLGAYAASGGWHASQSATGTYDYRYNDGTASATQCNGMARFIGKQITGQSVKTWPQKGLSDFVNNGYSLQPGDVVSIDNANCYHMAMVYSVTGDRATFIEALGGQQSKIATLC